ncbi:hypothetical protein RUM44_004710 [Polyplax serrata]|uniref:Uncharacterized protein n=1 Tax=Polyplax serrata TaxID=468196 RepID=A0ABR1B3L9_POLSC
MIKSQTQGGRTVEEDDEAEDEARKGSNSGAVKVYGELRERQVEADIGVDIDNDADDDDDD